MSNNRQMSFALASGGKGEFRLAQEVHAISWRLDGSDVLMSMPSAPELPTFRIGTPVDGIVLVQDTRVPESRSRFRSGRSLEFIRPLVGEWSDGKLSLHVFENGWATWNAGGPMYVRLEPRGKKLFFSFRVFEKWSDVELELSYDRQQLRLAYPSGEQFVLTRVVPARN